MVAATIAVSACATGGRGVPAAAPTPQTSVAGLASTTIATTYDTMWYVTNRARLNGRATRALADSLEYGLMVTRIARRPGPGSGGPFVESFSAQVVDSARFDRASFLARLHDADAAAATRGEGAVLYVHGYATSLGRAIAQGTEIAHRGSFHGPLIVFAWPAHVALATWPSPSALVSRAYRQDSVSASASIPAFLRVARDIHTAVRGPAMTIVGHSLGAQLTAEALSAPGAAHDALADAPMRALVLFAPDISATRYRDTLAPALEGIASRQVVYASDGDWMLGISRLVNHAARTGRAVSARALAPLGVEVVDVTHGRRADGIFHHFVEPHHAMKSASSALYDFFGVVRGLPSECRVAEGVTERASDGTWRLTNAVIPTSVPAPAAACAER